MTIKELTKQEEIREVMTENVELYLAPAHAKQLVSDILLDLHLQGVVIKVDDPNLIPIAFRVAVEPLIKDE